VCLLAGALQPMSSGGNKVAADKYGTLNQDPGSVGDIDGYRCSTPA